MLLLIYIYMISLLLQSLISPLKLSILAKQNGMEAEKTMETYVTNVVQQTCDVVP